MKVSIRFARSSERYARDAGAVAAVLLLLALLGGCTAYTAPQTRPVRGEWVGVASWYGPKYHGRQTASGRVYDMYGLTAAHRTLPFGTKLRVEHLRNRRAVVVEITDRGPFIDGRVLDLSYGAARRLDMVDEGLAKVRFRTVD